MWRIIDGQARALPALFAALACAALAGGCADRGQAQKAGRPGAVRTVEAAGAAAGAQGAGAAAAQETGPRAGLLVGLDDAFAESRPALAAALQKRPRLLASKPLYRSFAYREGPGPLLELLEQKRPAVLITSPFLARALIEGGRTAQLEAQGARKQGPTRILIAEWQAGLPAGFSAAVTDTESAMARAGAASGAFIKAQRSASRAETEGAMIFMQGPGRSQAAENAFAGAFEKEAGFPPLLREVSDAESADAALNELLGRDLGLLFLALGPAGPEIAARAARPSLAIGILATAPDVCAEADFGVFPDDSGLAAALFRLAEEPEGSAGSLVKVPALLKSRPGALVRRAGEATLDEFIQNAVKKYGE